MAKEIRKRWFWWFNEGQIEEIAAWLSAMAERGWHISHIGKFFAVFVRGEPREVRYRCDVFRSGSAEFKERLEFYKSVGWEHVASLRVIHIFRAPANADIPEIHTDPQEHAHALALLKWRLCLYSVLQILFLGWLIFFPLLYPRSYRLEVLLNSSIPYLAALPVLVYVIFQSIWGFFRVSRLIGDLHQGNRRQVVSYRGPLNRARAAGVLVVTVAVIVLAVQFVGAARLILANPYPPIPPGELPVPRLSELVQGDLRPVEVEGYENINNFFKTSSSFLVPDQWHLREEVEVPGAQWPWGSEYTPRLEVQGYRARWPWLAGYLTEELVAKVISYQREECLVALESSAFSSLWICWRQDNLGFQLIARQGEIVFFIRYHGTEPMEDMVRLVKQKIGHTE